MVSLFVVSGTVSAQKALQGSETETRVLLGGTEEKKCFPDKGSLIFLEKETEKNELVARPGYLFIIDGRC